MNMHIFMNIFGNRSIVTFETRTSFIRPVKNVLACVSSGSIFCDTWQTNRRCHTEILVSSRV